MVFASHSCGRTARVTSRGWFWHWFPCGGKFSVSDYFCFYVGSFAGLFCLCAGQVQVSMAWQSGPGFEQYGAQSGVPPEMQRPPPQAPVGPNNPLNDVFYGASSGLLGTYLGNSKDYVQSNVSRYFATHDIQYYFQVTDQYVKNKLKVVLCPFLHKV